LKLSYSGNQNFSEFYTANQNAFYELLKSKGEELFHIMRDSEEIDLELILESALTVVRMINEKNEQGLIMHAKEHGRNWAKYNLDLMLKLEWIQILRKSYWDFLYHYYKHAEENQLEFFELERHVNYNFDSYLKHFGSSYLMNKNEVFQSQGEAIDELSLPVIPLTDKIAVLPLVGALDTLRAKKIEEHVLDKIYQLKIEQIIIDLSGVPYMDMAIVPHLIQIANGVAIQGCEAVITGIRPEITNTMIEVGITLHEKVMTMGTLRQAIEENSK